MKIPAGLTPIQKQDIPAGLTPFSRNINRTKGAPKSVRLAVSAVDTPDDKLATLRKYYPEAQKFEDQFIFKDPKTSEWTLFDEDTGMFSWATAGDLADISPELFEIGGGTGGAVLGTSGAPGLGTYFGAGAGTLAGKELHRSMVKGLLPEVVDTRTGGRKLGDAATTFSVGLLGEGIGQGLSKVVGKVVGGGRYANQSARDMQDLGLDPTVGIATGSPTAQALEQNLAPKMSYSGGGIIRSANERYLEGLSEAQANLIRQSTGAVQNKEAAGAAVQSGLGRSIDTYNAFRNALEDRLEKEVGDEVRGNPAPLQELRDRLVGEVAEMPSGSQQINPIIDELNTLLEESAMKGGLQYRSLRNNRTKIGEKLARMDSSGYLPGGGKYAKQYQNAIQETLSDLVNKAGPKAVSLQNQFDTLVKTARDKLNPLSVDSITKLLQNPSPEKVVNRLTSGMNDGGTLLKKLQEKMPADEFKIFVSSVSNDLGMKSGEFNAAHFLKNWTKLAPSSKAALYKGDLAPLRTGLDKLANAIKPFKSAASEINRSQTARAQMITSALTGIGIGSGNPISTIFAAAATAVASEFGGRAMAKLMTNPKFVNWLVQSSSSIASSPTSVPATIGRLIAVGKAEPEIRQYIDTFVHQMSLPTVK